MKQNPNSSQLRSTVSRSAKRCFPLPLTTFCPTTVQRYYIGIAVVKHPVTNLSHTPFFSQRSLSQIILFHANLAKDAKIRLVELCFSQISRISRSTHRFTRVYHPVRKHSAAMPTSCEHFLRCSLFREIREICVRQKRYEKIISVMAIFRESEKNPCSGLTIFLSDSNDSFVFSCIFCFLILTLPLPFRRIECNLRGEVLNFY